MQYNHRESAGCMQHSSCYPPEHIRLQRGYEKKRSSEDSHLGTVHSPGADKTTGSRFPLSRPAGNGPVSADADRSGRCRSARCDSRSRLDGNRKILECVRFPCLRHNPPDSLDTTQHIPQGSASRELDRHLNSLTDQADGKWSLMLACSNSRGMNSISYATR